MSKKSIHYSCEGRIEKSVPRDHRFHHSASLVMPNGDPWDGFLGRIEKWVPRDHRLSSLGKPRDAKR